MTCFMCGSEIPQGVEHYTTNKNEAFCKPCGNREIFIEIQKTDPSIRRAVNAVYSFPSSALLLDVQRMLEHYRPTKKDGWKDRKINHIEHALQHLQQFQWGTSYDDKTLGTERRWHLVSAALRIMFEYWHETQRKP